MLNRLKGWGVLSALILIACCLIITKTSVYANSPQSTNYRFDESSINSSSLIQSSSTNFQINDATGDLVIGNTSSSNYQIDTGSKTTNDPTLSFSINSADVNFGSFTPTSTTVTSASFSVSNYTSYGYVVQISGNPPSNGSHTIAAMTETGDSQAGIEQFGINLVANTLPFSIGSNPDNGQFGYGTASPNYGTSNQYRYVSGETIAMAPKSSGVTSYTISYIINVTSLTPGGQYTGDQTIIVTGTY